MRRARTVRLLSGAALALLAAMSALLAGCGFHLQGHSHLPPALKTPYLEVQDRQSDFTLSLRHALMSNGAQLADRRDQASAVVTIVRDTFRKRTLVVSVNNQANEYEITYAVTFSVSTADKELLQPQELTVTRSYSFDERLLLAKGHEEDQLRADMARDLADRAMRLMSNL
jgi:LPS-assembly lipoprotein